MLGLIIIDFIVLWLGIGCACSLIAQSKNRDKVMWFWGGFFLSVIGLILITLLPPAKKSESYEKFLQK